MPCRVSNVRHILFFSNHLRGPQGAAGARSWHQARCLSERFDITVVIPAVDPVTATPVTEETYEGLDAKRVQVVRVPVLKNDRSSKLRRALYFLSAMGSQLRAGFAARHPDLVLTMSLPVTLLFVAALVAWLRRAPLIVDVRDLPFDTAGEVGYLRSRRLIALLKWLETRLLHRARIVLTNSPYYVCYLQERGLSTDRLVLAPIGYDDFGEPTVEHVAKWRSRLLALFGQEPPEFIGFYAGTLGHAFPVEEILDGAALLRDIRGIGFVFYGDGQRIDEYRSLAARRGIRAMFPGRISKSDVHAACRAADFCVYPASPGKFSGAILGNKVFDYLGAGRPVVYVGGGGAVADVLTQLDAGILCANKAPAQFAGAVRSLWNNVSLRGRLAAGARGFRAAGYTARASAERLRELVDLTLTGR